MYSVTTYVKRYFPSYSVDKMTKELAMVVKDIRALRDLFEP